jgi:hypothetical protein
MLSRPPPFDKIVMRGTIYLEVDGDIGDGHSGVVSDGVKLSPVAILGAPAFQTSLTFFRFFARTLARRFISAERCSGLKSFQ